MNQSDDNLIMTDNILQQTNRGSLELVDGHEFFVRSGMIRDYLELKDVPIPQSSVNGHFEPEYFTDLLDFCKQNPNFHIISYKNRTYYNCPISAASCYFLGDGEKNLKLAFHNTTTLAETLQVAKFLMS